MALRYERLEKGVLDRYKAKRKSHHVYTAAARLWSAGMDFQAALTIVREACDAALHEVSAD